MNTLKRLTAILLSAAILLTTPGCGRTGTSQALELLMSGNLMKVHPEEYGDYSASMINSMIYVIQIAVAYGSFELQCFGNPDMTAEEMNAAFESLLKECVYGPDGEVAMSPRAWAEKPLLFDAPLYYISYAPSALSAMDLYSEYITDRESGTKKYEALLYADPNLPYGEAMKATGLRNMISGEAVTVVCDTLYRYYEEECAAQGDH